MLVSHRHRFVCMKTRKTGGTSVEIYLEPFCAPEGDPEAGRAHYRAAQESAAGIIGARGVPVTPALRWFNHMSAEAVRAGIGAARWDAYRKVCVVRDPYERAVSQFWWLLDEAERARLAAAPFDAVRAAYRGWILGGGHLDDERPVYAIGGRFALDGVIRHERLADDLAGFCAQVGVPWDPARLGRFKAEHRRRAEPGRDYQDGATRARVQAVWGQEFDWFGYPR